MKLKTYVPLILTGLLIPAILSGLDVTIAEIYQYNPEGTGNSDKTITGDLIESLLSKKIGCPVTFALADSHDPPKSILEAAALGAEESRDLILYGFVKITDRYYDLEIKLYDRKAGKIQKIFYAKESFDGYKNLIGSISNRILDYFCNIGGVSQRKKEAQKEYGITAAETRLGYWFPFDPWAYSLMGIGSFNVSVSLTPVSPLFSIGFLRFSLSYGISLGFAPGLNREGFESFFLHSVNTGIPVTLSVLWSNRNRVYLRITPEAQFDILVQDRLYGSTVTEKSGAFSLATAMGYEYIPPGKHFSYGCSVEFQTAFYKPVVFTMTPGLSVRYRFIERRKGEE